MTEQPTYKIHIGQGTKRKPAEKRVLVVNVTDGGVYVYVSKKNVFQFCDSVCTPPSYLRSLTVAQTT